MFERNKIDNAPDQNAVPVEVLLTDGETVKGKMFVPALKTVADALNGSGGFIEFEPYGGERSFLGKAQLASLKPVGVPRAPSLKARTHDIDGFDPHVVLGVTADATRAQIHGAYVQLARAYHPDRYATAELPDEVRDYLSIMARRINAAYAALEVPEKKRKLRQEPVFSSGSRF
jgi:hypothetical protein